MKINYFIIFLIGVLMNIGGSRFTKLGLDWYYTLQLPNLAPPGFIIGIVWMVLTILTCISAIIFWNNFKNYERYKIVVKLFIVSVFFNLVWSYLFFYRHLIVLALIDMIFLILTMVALIILIRPKSKLASNLLIPYPLWVTFATYLTISIWFLNPEAF